MHIAYSGCACCVTPHMWPSSKYLDLGHWGRVKCPKKQGHMFSSMEELFQFLQSKLSFSFSFNNAKNDIFSLRNIARIANAVQVTI